jgi:hypothetical protein
MKSQTPGFRHTDAELRRHHRDLAVVPREAAPVSILTTDEFVRRTLTAAAPPQRVSEVVSRLVGNKIKIGPISAGPCEAASATAIGLPGAVHAELCDDAAWDQTVTIPIDLSVLVEVAGGIARFRGPVQVQTRIRLRIEQPCDVVVEVEDVYPHNITAAVEGIGVSARIVGRLGGIDDILSHQVLTYVNDLIRSPEFEAALHIDVTGLLGRAWEADLVIGIPGADE